MKTPFKSIGLANLVSERSFASLKRQSDLRAGKQAYGLKVGGNAFVPLAGMIGDGFSKPGFVAGRFRSPI